MEFLGALTGGLSGALFAFLFFWVSTVIQEKRKCIKEYKDSLFQIQLLLNLAIDRNHKNIQTIDSIKKNLKLSSETEIPIDYHSLVSLSIDGINPLLGKVINGQLLNTIFELNISLAKVNDSVYAYEKRSSEIRSAILSKTLTPSEYLNNTEQFVEDLAQRYKPFFIELQPEIVQTLAYIKVLMNDFRLKRNLFKTKYYYTKNPKNFESKLSSEIQKLQSQIKASQQRSTTKNKRTFQDEP